LRPIALLVLRSLVFWVSNWGIEVGLGGVYTYALH
jgi:hypothetical protein